jgi:outer membrane protein insertion porin family
MYYWEKGYIDAKVVNVTRDIDPESTEGKNLLLLTIYITEGEQYTYGGMTFEGNTIISTEALNSMLRLAPGSVLNKTRLEQDYAKVTDLYYNDGYIYNVITRQEIRNEAEKTISYHVVIVEKSRAHIENIILKGNSKTKDSVILREIPIIEGDVFSKDKVLQGIQNLYNTQYFSNIIPETPYGSAEGLMDLVINVEEGRTTEVNFGLTFSGGLGDVPVSGFVKWVDKNFLGRGQEFSLGTEVSSTTQSLTVGFTENWLAGKRWSAGVNLSFSHSLLSGQYQDFLAPFNVGGPDPYDGHYVWASSGENATGYTQDDIDDGTVVTDYEYAVDNDESIADGYLMEYDSWEFAISLSTGYSIHTPYGRLGFGGGIKPSLDMIDYDPTKYRAYDEDVRNGLGEWKYNNRLWFSVSWDKRDYIYSPSKGYYFTEILTYTGGLLFGQTNYIKSVTRAEFYQKVFEIPMSDEWDLKMIFASRSALSLIFPQFYYDSTAGKWVVGKAATTSDLLYTDGMMVARGWYPRKTDGQAMWDTMLELRVPIVEQYIWFDLFGSGTGFWGSSDTVMNPFLSLKGMTINDYLFTLGGGLRFTIPGLPIGMYLVKRFKFEDNVFKWQEGVMFKDSDRENSGLDFVIALTMYM